MRCPSGKGTSRDPPWDVHASSDREPSTSNVPSPANATRRGGSAGGASSSGPAGTGADAIGGGAGAWGALARTSGARRTGDAHEMTNATASIERFM
ncbi:MAG: hypothetical protein AMXMBFR56_59510 [Polyangiaceae bacterium]